MSALSDLWDQVKRIAVLAVIAWVGWYAYSLIDPVSPDAGDSPQVTAFNCRQALTKLAKDYQCRDSGACTMTRDELIELKNREADIEQHCN